MQKNYATSCTFNKTCMLKRDYSYITNGKCLDCKFCYRHAVPGTNFKVRAATMLRFEEKISPTIYKVPITISRYCDPNYSPGAYRNSVTVANKILDCGGQVIWKTARVNNIPLLSQLDKDNFQYQGRIITADTKTGAIVRKMIAPNFEDPRAVLMHLGICKYRMDVAISFDPLILGLNDADLYIVAQQAAQHGITKIIVKQLFATDYFKAFLATNVGKDCSNLLSEKVGPFWTYRSDVLMNTMHNVLQDAEGTGITFSMCGNKDINALLNGHSNCCLFDNPNAVYDLNVTGKGQQPGIIELRTNNVA